ncbi:MAG: molybdopterin-dependent oxidoreductase, partial [Verrucomicrobia bacterium]|nr:molybdopterin-dependent oxidoreductase [Verrucomicrobiota bacterium]
MSSLTASSPGFSFSLNGQQVCIGPETSPNTTLLNWLRSTGRVGTKEGCAEGDCGACTVAWVERDAHGRPTYRAVNSCLVLLPMAAGRELVTVEGLEQGGQLHPVQKCFAHCHASQCGYCTPGFVVSAFEGWQRPDLQERWQLDDQLAGNLCRCTGYRPIRDAASRAFAKRPPSAPAEAPAELTALEFAGAGERFYRPASLAEFFALRAQHPEARLVAGGTELSLFVTKKFQRFPVLISLEGLGELRRFERTADALHLGGGLTLTQLDEHLAADPAPAWSDPRSVLRNILRWFGSRQIRSRATIGGNLCTASPIGDLAPAFLALDATLVLVSPAGERTLPIADFFLDYRKTALRPNELLLRVEVPRGPRNVGAVRQVRSCKVSRRREMDISTVAGVFCVEVDATGVVQHTRLAYGGVAATPKRATAAESWLLGRIWNEALLPGIRPLLEGAFTPLTDVRGGQPYRTGLIGDLFGKFLRGEGEPELDRTPLENIDPWPGLAQWPEPHESARGHVTGRARYVDDQQARAGMLETWIVTSPHAHARILRRDATKARGLPGIHAVLLAEDIPGLNDVGAVRHDEILLAEDLVSFHGHPVALVIGETAEQCRAAAAAVEVEYEPLPAILQVAEAVRQGSFHTDFHRIRRGDPTAAFADASLQQLQGEFSFGGQEHFYLESQCAWAEPGEEPGEMLVHSSTQHPTEIQTIVAHVLDRPKHLVIVQSPRMGGGFGGKETQGNTFAALAALGAHHTGRAVRVWLNRDQDMMLTGKRHPFLARWQVAHDRDGRIRALQAELFADGGWSLDLSTAIADRAILHLDNAYYLPVVSAASRVCKTHLSSNTAFRGFGGPQGMLVIEEVMDHVARNCGLPPEVVRERNLYHGSGPTNTTHYGQEIGDNRLQRIWHELKQTSDFDNRRAELAVWNARSVHAKRGLAITPVKFGISFTLRHLNQAGALVLIYADGSVQVNHGGTEMGQGPNTKVAQVVAHELGVPF